jgi:chloride intracellular channel protein 2
METVDSVTINNGSKGDSVPSNHVELFVKAGKDGESLGGCPFCQRMFMILMIRANAGELTFTVTTVNMAKPPPDFKKLASRLPVVVHGTEILSDPDEMIQYVDEHFPYPPLIYDNVKAAEACMDVFSKFSFYIKDVSHKPDSLLVELKKLNGYLEMSPHQFLCRDKVPDHLDCLMMPKLQHIRVVTKAVRDFDIPAELTGVWRYLKNMYAYDVFRSTCPSDQEIVNHWTVKPELPRMSKQKAQYYSTEGAPRHSFDVPGEAS